MASKPLNKANLTALGAEVLADLLLEAVKGDAARQRRVRMALAADEGPETVSADIRKRFAAIRRAKGFLNRPSQKKLAQELTEAIQLIETRIAPTAPGLAFDLLWTQLHLAEGIHERTDDSWGTIGDTMRAAMQAIGEIAPHLTLTSDTLAEQILEATLADGYGAFDRAIEVLAPALGPEGLAALKDKATAAFEAPIAASDLARYDYGRPSERESRARQYRSSTLERILQDVADQQGDVDGWMAKYTPEQLAYHTIAPDAATRLLDAGRAEEALALIRTALAAQKPDQRSDWHDPRELDDAHFACLSALGRKAELREALWARFEARLCPDALRHHLKLLPDFEDIDAEDTARAIVLAYPSMTKALWFCHTTQDLQLARQLIDARYAELNGNVYEILTPLAEELAPNHPLQAALLWRALIDFALTQQRKGRYGHAARHLQSCAEADTRISDYRPHLSHAAYLQALEDTHAHLAASKRRN
ncbi:DUF6880 family protein (plasmid) [Thioclava sp. 'Guangxiensis']|uniref:DUF6880 family protein n=1 Tax=Thioclava sp. 'Guangxiensis' TaxID=3149044 RepID=UPI0032C4ACF9